MATRLGKNTIKLLNVPSVVGYASIVGKKEGEGPLADNFDYISEDNTFGEKTWEKAESRLQQMTLSKSLDKAGLPPDAVNVIFAGDLLNQCIGSSFGLRDFGVPFLGLFGACSTMAESLGMASVFVDAGAAGIAAALTSSHFCSAERQFRFPLEYGGQRTQSAQWTVTGAGAVILSPLGQGPYIKEFTVGKIVDLGVKDANNMGAAMAPAAAATLKAFFDDTGTAPKDYDLIVSGDLGRVGASLMRELLQREGVMLGENYNDCGLMIFDGGRQDVHAGGSGCGCSASVLCSHILNNMKSGNYREVLFIATGALMNATSTQQGESIPSIAHLVHISNAK